MGISYNPRTVTDGLVLELDAGNEKKSLGIELTGQAEYTSSGTYSWTCPSNVTSVCVVCVGGGAGGPGNTWNGDESGGGGGGLGYKNNISVTAGQSYTVVVGSGGFGPQNGGDSYFINPTIVKGGGGSYGYQGTAAPGGTYVGDGGGNGGDGGDTDGQTGAYGGGGGGAGGYSGKGGDGSNGKESGVAILNGPGQDGSGGGGGGGSSNHGGSGGGGVGIYGEGPSGAGDQSVSGETTYGGRGGSGGSPGSTGAGGPSPYNGGDGGAYGGGAGGGADGARPNSTGGGGAVRIIWGSGRSFPTTLTSNQPATSAVVWKNRFANGNSGTLTGVVHNSDGYFTYDSGTGDHITFSEQTLSGDFTLDVWIYKTATRTSSGNYSIIAGSALTASYIQSRNNQFYIDNSGAGKIGLVINATVVFNSTSTPVSLNTWHNLVWTRSGTTCKAYVDGVEHASGTNGDTVYIGNFGKYNITTGDTYAFIGRLSLAKLYNGKGLTAAEVKQNYNALRGRFGV